MRARELDQIHQFVVVDAADDDRVELEAREERRGGVDAGEDTREARRRASVWKRSGFSVSRLTVTRWRPASRSVRRVRRQQHAVGGHREIANAGRGREARDERREIAAEQRLAAGEPDLVDAEPANTSTSRSISSNCRMSSRGSHT